MSKPPYPWQAAAIKAQLPPEARRLWDARWQAYLERENRQGRVAAEDGFLASLYILRHWMALSDGGSVDDNALIRAVDKAAIACAVAAQGSGPATVRPPPDDPPPSNSKLSYSEAARLIVEGVKDRTYSSRWDGMLALEQRVRTKGKPDSVRRHLLYECRRLYGPG
jgi:hypothetical protein